MRKEVTYNIFEKDIISLKVNGLATLYIAQVEDDILEYDGKEILRGSKLVLMPLNQDDNEIIFEHYKRLIPLTEHVEHLKEQYKQGKFMPLITFKAKQSWDKLFKWAKTGKK